MLLRFNSTLLLLALVLAPLCAQTKQDKRDLQRDLETYRRVSMHMDVDSLLLFMPPKMFEMIPREQLKTQIEQAFDNEEVYMRFDSMNMGQFAEIKKAGDYLCTLIPYTGRMEMHFKEPRDSAFLEIMVPMLEMQFSKGDIQIAGPDSSLYLTIALQQKSMIGFKKAGFDSWKFIEDKRQGNSPADTQQQQMIKMFVPEEVLKATE